MVGLQWLIYFKINLYYLNPMHDDVGTLMYLFLFFWANFLLHTPLTLVVAPRTVSRLQAPPDDGLSVAMVV